VSFFQVGYSGNTPVTNVSETPLFSEICCYKGGLKRPGGTKMLLSLLRVFAVAAALACGTVLFLTYKFLFVLIAGIGLATAYFVEQAESVPDRESQAEAG
jgi:hypothetical protein